MVGNTRFVWTMVLSLDVDLDFFDYAAAPVLFSEPRDRAFGKNPGEVTYQGAFPASPCPLVTEGPDWLRSTAEKLIDESGIDEPEPAWFDSPSGWDLLYLFLKPDAFSLGLHVTAEQGLHAVEYLLIGKEGPLVNRLEGLNEEQLEEIIRLLQGKG